MRKIMNIFVTFVLFSLISGCSTTMGKEKQYLRLISDSSYTGIEMSRDGTKAAIPTIDLGYHNLQSFARDQLAQRLAQGLITREEYDSTIKDLDAEQVNQDNALATVKQVPPTLEAVLYAMGIDPGPKRPKSLQDTLIPLGVGIAAGTAIGAAAF